MSLNLDISVVIHTQTHTHTQTYIMNVLALCLNSLTETSQAKVYISGKELKFYMMEKEKDRLVIKISTDVRFKKIYPSSCSCDMIK